MSDWRVISQWGNTEQSVREELDKSNFDLFDTALSGVEVNQ